MNFLIKVLMFITVHAPLSRKKKPIKNITILINQQYRH